MKLYNVRSPVRYETLEHTADVYVRARGIDLCECFTNAAYALFDQMVDVSTVRPLESRTFEVEGVDPEELLYDLLSELLCLHDTEGLVFSEFEVAIGEGRLQCKAHGEGLDLERHRPRSEVKAITYHMLKIDPEGHWVTVIFDV